MRFSGNISSYLQLSSAVLLFFAVFGVKGQVSHSLIESSHFISPDMGYSELDYLPESNVFAYTLRGMAFEEYPAQVGIWDDVYIENENETTGFKTVFLDDNWEVLDVFEGAGDQFTTGDLRWNFYKNGIGSAQYRQYDGAINDISYDIYGDLELGAFHFFGFEFDALGQALTPLVLNNSESEYLFWSNLIPANVKESMTQSLQGYESIRINAQKSIFQIPAVGDQYLNGELISDLSFNKLGYHWIGYDHQTGEIEITTVVPDNGYVAINKIEKVSPAEFCHGVVTTRGNGVELDVLGTEVESLEDDSTYTYAIFKSHYDGSMTWATPLYSFQNVQSDTVLFGGAGRSHDCNMEYMGGRVFLSESAQFRINDLSDTLVYKDFFGNDTLFHLNSTPYVNEDGYEGYFFGKSTLYAVDDDTGEPLGLLELDGFKFARPLTSFAPTDEESYLRPKVFSLKDSLAWSLDHYASNDTIIQFNRKMMDGSTSAYPISLSQGYNLVILWMDDDLNISGHWVIEADLANEQSSRGIYISEIASFGQDSILIAASIDPLVSTNMDPSGQLEPSAATYRTSFLGLYSPNTLGLQHQKKPLDFNIFPNPANTAINLSLGSQINLEYRLFDQLGRPVKNGNIGSAQLASIDVQDLSPGIYFVELQNDEFIGVQKVIISR